MRSGVAESRIETTQQTSSYKPYVTVDYYSGGWQPITGANIWEIQHTEGVYSSSCTIKLNNYDGDYNSLDIRNKLIRIGWGANTASGDEVSYAAYLWGTGQRLTSSEEGVWFIIWGEGAWDKLRRWICDNEYRYNQDDATYDNYTVKEILNHICESAGSDIGADIGSLDGKVDSWEPVVDAVKGQSGLDIAKGILGLTKCVLVPREDDLSLKYPADGDPVDRTYTSDSAPYFDISASQSILFRPMKVIVSDLDGHTGEYADADWSSGMGAMDVTVRAGVTTSNDDCVWLATAIVERAKGERDTGVVIVPMDSLLEVHDKVTITDNRDGTGATGRVGSIYRHYVADTGIYDMEVRLGGYQRELASDLNSLVMDVASFGTIDGTKVIQGSLFPAALFRTAQDYKLDITFTPVDSNTVEWSAGTIHFADGTSEGINGGTKTSISGDTYIYFNLSEKTSGSLDLQNTVALMDTIGERKGRVAFVKNAASGKGSAVCIVPAGKDAYLNADFVTCGALSALHANLGTVNAGSISGVNINGSTITGGTITGGYITGGTVDGALVQGGTIKVDDGRLNFYYGGSKVGAVKTRDAGVTELVVQSESGYDAHLSALQNNALLYGYIDAEVRAVTGNITLDSSNDIIFDLASQTKHVRPDTDDRGNLGGASHAWHEVHSYSYVTESCPSFPIMDYLEGIAGINVRTKDMHLVQDGLPDYIKSGDRGMIVENLISLALGGIMELKDRLEVLEEIVNDMSKAKG